MKLLTMVISDKSYSKFKKRKPVIQNEEIHFQLFQTKEHFFEEKNFGVKDQKVKTEEITTESLSHQRLT